MDKKIRSSFENLSLGEEQKNRMWDEIVKKTDKTEKKSYKMPKTMRITATFALVAIMILSNLKDLIYFVVRLVLIKLD